MKKTQNRHQKIRRQSHNPIKIVGRALEQSHLIKLQRLFLKYSSRPNLVYQDSLLLDYPNPAMDPSRTRKLDIHFEVDYLLHNLYRKIVLPGITQKDQLEKAAYSSFFKGERENVRTNRRLRARTFDDVETNTMVWRIQNEIAMILGPVNFDKIAELSHFSSGATQDLKLNQASLQEKFAFRSPSVTRDALVMWYDFISKIDTAATGLGKIVKIVPGNRVLTVPKSNSTDRTIAAEPTLNMYFQLGVGSYIRRRLRRAGVNLNDQSINQELARTGSIDGALCTLDLANASNSLSFEAVKLLLPKEWFDVLNALRSPYGSIKGKSHRYRMFSSMGNGYTFELESLIFFAIARCASAYENRSKVSVYGDDIITATADAQNVIKWLQYFGFRTNTEKSFTTGYFRESCGKHYHSGYDVSPFFVRRLPRALDIYLLFNNIVRWSTKQGFDPRFEEALTYVLNLIPEDSRVYGPDGYGDGHLLEVDSVTPKTEFKYLRSSGALTFKSICLVFSKRRANQRGALCASLLGHTKENTMSLISDSHKKSYRLKRIEVRS